MNRIIPLKAIGINFGVDRITNSVAYFLGGLLAADETVEKNNRKFWVAPFRYNSTYATETQINLHYDSVKKASKNLRVQIYTRDTIVNQKIDSGKFSRMRGFGAYFESPLELRLADKYQDILSILKSSSEEIQRCFVVGLFDGRSSIDCNESEGILRFLSLDVVNPLALDMFKDVLGRLSVKFNVNEPRERLEGGAPRKVQLRVKDVEDFMGRFGLISDKKVEKIRNVLSSEKFEIIEQNEVLPGVTILTRN